MTASTEYLGKVLSQYWMLVVYIWHYIILYIKDIAFDNVNAILFNDKQTRWSTNDDSSTIFSVRAPYIYSINIYEYVHFMTMEGKKYVYTVYVDKNLIEFDFQYYWNKYIQRGNVQQEKRLEAFTTPILCIGVFEII